MARKCGSRKLAAGIRSIFSIFHSSIFSISAQCSSAGGDSWCTALGNTSPRNIIFAKMLWQPETFLFRVSVQTGSRGEQSLLLILLRIAPFNVLNNTPLVVVWKWWKFVVIQRLNKAEGTAKDLINWQFALSKLRNIAC